MSAIAYRNGTLMMEDVPLERLAREIGTPLFAYSSALLERQYRAYEAAFARRKALICYALKANSNQAVIASFSAMGAGADIVSEGELHRALAAGVPASKIVFAGVGKTEAEMAAALDAGVLQFNVESEPELLALSRVAVARGRVAPVSLRVNPDVDAGTHAKITTGRTENKFGIDYSQVPMVAARARDLPGIRLDGLAVHIGSQLTTVAPFGIAFAKVADLARRLIGEGHRLRRFDIGGGLGVSYRGETPPDLTDYAAAVDAALAGLELELVCEPGRFMVAEAGVLLTRIIYVKHGLARRFLIVDAAMNDLIRPTLYEAWHPIWPVAEPAPGAALSPADVVGPVCESGDILAEQRELPAAAAGDLLAIGMAGAYGAVMSSTYNSRPLAAEVLVRAGDYAVVRPRSSYDELIALDRLPPWLSRGRERRASRVG